MSRQRLLVAALTLSLSGFAAWQANEGYSEQAHIPVAGDRPTIGHGSTRWEDGRAVKLGDTVSRERAEVLARHLLREDERRFAASLPGVRLHQEEYDLYMDFVGQFGIGNWRQSSMRKHLLAGRYRDACASLLLWRRGPRGVDCATPGNRVCAGVWTRQLRRYQQCMAVQG